MNYHCAFLHICLPHYSESPWRARSMSCSLWPQHPAQGLGQLVKTCVMNRQRSGPDWAEGAGWAWEGAHHPRFSDPGDWWGQSSLGPSCPTAIPTLLLLKICLVLLHMRDALRWHKDIFTLNSHSNFDICLCKISTSSSLLLVVVVVVLLLRIDETKIGIAIWRVS